MKLWPARSAKLSDGGVRLKKVAHVSQAEYGLFTISNSRDPVRSDLPSYRAECGLPQGSDIE